MSLLMPPTIPSILTETAKRAVNHIAFTRDGSRVALGHVGMAVEVREGERVLYQADLYSRNRKVRSTQRVRGVAFSPDGDVIYVAAGEMARAVRVETGEPLWSHVPPRSFGFLVISPIALAVSSAGDIALAFDNGTFGVWSPEGQRQVQWRENDSPRYLGFLPNGGQIVGSDSFSLCTWDVEAGKRVMNLSLPERVYAIDVAVHGPFVAARGLETTQIWNMESGSLLSRAPNGLGLPVVALHPVERLMALGDGNGLSVVDFNGRFVRRYESGDASVLSAAFSPDGSRLLAGGSDGELWTWDFA